MGNWRSENNRVVARARKVGCRESPNPSISNYSWMLRICAQAFCDNGFERATMSRCTPAPAAFKSGKTCVTSLIQTNPSSRTVVWDPRVSFGRPTISKSGVLTSVIAERINAGEDINEVAKDCGIQPEEVMDVLVYEKVS